MEYSIGGVMSGIIAIILLFKGRMMDGVLFIICSILYASPVPSWIVSPSIQGVRIEEINPRAVSSTYVKSLFGQTSPNSKYSGWSNNCPIIVGIIARADCLGPKVLNGRRVTTGRPNER